MAGERRCNQRRHWHHAATANGGGHHPGNGSDVRLFDNWTGRPTSVRVVNAQTEAKRRAMGASSIGGNVAPPPPGGCYLAPTDHCPVSTRRA